MAEARVGTVFRECISSPLECVALSMLRDEDTRRERLRKSKRSTQDKVAGGGCEATRRGGLLPLLRASNKTQMHTQTTNNHSRRTTSSQDAASSRPTWPTAAVSLIRLPCLLCSLFLFFSLSLWAAPGGLMGVEAAVEREGEDSVYAIVRVGASVGGGVK